MPSTFWITALQWAICVTGIVAFAMSTASLAAAMEERDALVRSKMNGNLAAAARTHFITAFNRAVASLLSVGGGLALIMMPDFVIPTGVVAGCAWFAYNLLMTANLSVELWARHTMTIRTVETRWHTTQVNAIACVIERAADRAERAVERAERIAERTERAAELRERIAERLERAAKISNLG